MAAQATYVWRNHVERLSRCLRWTALITAVLLIALVAFPSAADAVGTLEGIVTDGHESVAGAEVAVIELDGLGYWQTATTNASGRYSVTTWAEHVDLGINPPEGASDGYFADRGVSVSAGTTTVVNTVLPETEADGRLSGQATYVSGAPDAGVEVLIEPAHLKEGGSVAKKAFTSSDGSWSYGALPAGTYHLAFIVFTGGSYTTAASQYVVVGEGEARSVPTRLEGAPPEATVVLTVREAGGALGSGTATFTSSDGTATNVGFTGSARTTLPGGTYTLHIAGNPGGLSDTGELTTSVAVADGYETHLEYEVPPMPVPTGTTASNAAQDLAYLNAERERSGLPGGITENPNWSQACGAHDAYLAANHVLEHPEYPDRVGYSPGGEWAGTHSVLAGGAHWEADANPWENAPIHLVQLFTPELTVIGIDESHGYACATTWPGIKPAAWPAGTVMTYPGNGETGVSPSEDASELPFVPGQFVGIPEGTVAGRELLVYEPTEVCLICGSAAPEIELASLVGPSGPVAVKWVDGSTLEVSGYLTGAIIIPVAPLAADATYTATVSLAPQLMQNRPGVSHTWVFSTGAENAVPGTSRRTEAPRSNLISRLAIKPRAFRLRRAGHRGRGSGATVTYRDARVERASFEVLRRLPGRISNGRCVAPTNRLRHARSCTRERSAAAFLRRDRRGEDSFFFGGWIKGRALAAGRYVLRARSLGASTAATVSFTILG